MASKNEKGGFGKVLTNIIKQVRGKKRKNVVLTKAKISKGENEVPKKKKKCLKDLQKVHNIYFFFFQSAFYSISVCVTLLIFNFLAQTSLGLH